MKKRGLNLFSIKDETCRNLFLFFNFLLKVELKDMETSSAISNLMFLKCG